MPDSRRQDFGMSRDVEDSAYYTTSDTNARMPLR